MKYWESKLTVKEAQAYSQDGCAVFGNPAMKDVIWEKDCAYPKWWIGKGYRPADPEKFKDRIGWVPNEPTKEYDEKMG